MFQRRICSSILKSKFLLANSPPTRDISPIHWHQGHCSNIPRIVLILLYTVRKFNWWRLALYNEIFYLFTLFDETLHHIELCNSVVLSVKNSEIRQYFVNSVEIVYSEKTCGLNCLPHQQWFFLCMTCTFLAVS